MNRGFITKIDFSDNRQVKQDFLTNTVLSGSTIMGTTFSDLPNGPSTELSGITENLSGVTGTFTGTTGFTTFIFSDNRLDIATPYFSAITPITSAETQSTGNIFVSNETTIIDGNLVNLSYSGVSYNLVITDMIDLGGTYSGETYSNNIKFLSADTLDYTGRTIWCNIPGILQVENRIETDILVVTNSISACSGTIYATNFSGCSPMNLYGTLILEDGNATITGDLTVMGSLKLSGTNTEVLTETIVAEDNNIELNYNGTHASALGGGLKILNGKVSGDSSINIDNEGYWIIDPGLILPEYTPINSNDITGSIGLLTWDDDYLYIKTNNGWRRANLSAF